MKTRLYSKKLKDDDIISVSGSLDQEEKYIMLGLCTSFIFMVSKVVIKIIKCYNFVIYPTKYPSYNIITPEI